MTGSAVNEARVKTLIDAYGADPARWPQEERAEAAALLARLPELEAYRNEALLLDTLLKAHAAALPDAALIERVVAARPRRARENPLRALIEFLLPGEAAWIPAGALAASMAFGIYVGMSGAFMPAASDTETQAALMSLALADTAVEDNWNE